MQIAYPPFNDEEKGFLESHAYNLIYNSGMAWSFERLKQNYAIRELLVKIVRILALTIIALCMYALIRPYGNFSDGEITMYVAMQFFSLLTFAATYHRHRLERKFLSVLWAWSSNRISKKLLHSLPNQPRELTITRENIAVSPNKISTKKITAITESSAFLLLISRHKVAGLSTPAFFFLRNTSEINHAIKRSIPIDNPIKLYEF